MTAMCCLRSSRSGKVLKCQLRLLSMHGGIAERSGGQLLAGHLAYRYIILDGMNHLHCTL